MYNLCNQLCKAVRDRIMYRLIVCRSHKQAWLAWNDLHNIPGCFLIAYQNNITTINNSLICTFEKDGLPAKDWLLHGIHKRFCYSGKHTGTPEHLQRKVVPGMLCRIM